MWLPTQFWQSVIMLIVALVSLGSWPNFVKITAKRDVRFEYFYLDFLLGGISVGVFAALTFGSYIGSQEPTVLDNITNVTASRLLYALAGGVLFAVAEVLLVAAVTVAGIAVAFPVAVGLNSVNSYAILK